MSDIDRIKKLIKLLEESDLKKLHMKEGEFEVMIEKADKHPPPPPPHHKRCSSKKHKEHVKEEDDEEDDEKNSENLKDNEFDVEEFSDDDNDYDDNNYEDFSD